MREISLREVTLERSRSKVIGQSCAAENWFLFGGHGEGGGEGKRGGGKEGRRRGWNVGIGEGRRDKRGGKEGNRMWELGKEEVVKEEEG